MEKSSTTKAQKIFIWVILITMAIGSVGAYFVVIIANNNQADDQRQAAQQQKQQEEQAAMPKEPLPGYQAAPFDKNSVTDLKVEELVPGTGKTATESSTVTANYFGWTSDGKIFDSTTHGGQPTPIDFALNQVIKGWTDGLKGAKEGSVRRLTIPAAEAYGDSAPTGYPSGPLMFVVELVKVK